MNVEFTKENWEASDDRINLADDLIAKRLLIGMNKLEIIQMLGDEFNDQYSNRWRYYLGSRNRWINLKKYNLVIYFDQNQKVNKVLKK